MSGRSSSPAGVGTDEHGWFGAVATDGVLAEPALVALLADAASAASVAQAVVRPDGRLGFVAVRLSAPDAVELERAHGLPALDAAIGTAVHRVVRLLHEHGLRARVLDPDGLLAALVEANDLDGPPQEHWASWGSGRQAHTFYLVRSDRLGAPAAAAGFTWAISVAADGTSAMLVRVTAPSGRVGAGQPGVRRRGRPGRAPAAPPRR